MNKKAQTIFLSVVSGIFIFLFGILFLTFIDNEVLDTETSNSSLFPNGGGPGLNCGSSSNPNLSISDGNKLSCLATETVVPYFIILLISIAGGTITARFLL